MVLHPFQGSGTESVLSISSDEGFLVRTSGQTVSKLSIKTISVNLFYVAALQAGCRIVVVRIHGVDIARVRFSAARPDKNLQGRTLKVRQKTPPRCPAGGDFAQRIAFYRHLVRQILPAQRVWKLGVGQGAVIGAHRLEVELAQQLTRLFKGSLIQLEGALLDPFLHSLVADQDFMDI